jgi:fluoroquinolone resistance protein
MEQAYDETFEKIDFKTNPLKKGEYESCSFKNCDLSEADLADIRFMDCHFTGCNLSLAKFQKTFFQDVKFKDCKMLGLRFEHCDPFNLSFGFDNCQLNHSSFYRLKLKKILFKNCQLQECDFTDTDLSNAVLDDCDLAKSTFENTILEKGDLRTAYNYTIDPELNRVKKARFSLQGVPGLLTRYDIEIE